VFRLAAAVRQDFVLPHPALVLKDHPFSIKAAFQLKTIKVAAVRCRGSASPRTHCANTYMMRTNSADEGNIIDESCGPVKRSDDVRAFRVVT
jgi:hypothetical protein